MPCEAVEVLFKNRLPAVLAVQVLAKFARAIVFVTCLTIIAMLFPKLASRGRLFPFLESIRHTLGSAR